jgi:hypothetical protein
MILYEYIEYILLAFAFLAVGVFLYFLISTASRFEQDRNKRHHLFKRAQKIKEKLDNMETP